MKAKRGVLVHCIAAGIRRDLAPEEIPTLVCGKRIKGPRIVDDNITCPACLEILFNAN